MGGWGQGGNIISYREGGMREEGQRYGEPPSLASLEPNPQQSFSPLKSPTGIPQQPWHPSEHQHQLSPQHQKEEQNQHLHCRYCHEPTKPLLQVCSCTGSMQFVHEKCILSWIQKRLESADELTITMPICQVCGEAYQGRMRIGGRRLSWELLKGRVTGLGIGGLVHGVGHLVMAIICIIAILSAFNTLYFSYQSPTQATKTAKKNNDHHPQSFQYIFQHIVLQLYGILHFISFVRSKKVILEESMVQIVEIMLLPKEVRKY